jgi:chemotaxis response regulator CheB
MGPRTGKLVQQVPPSAEPDGLDTPKPAQRFPHAAFDVVAVAASAGGIAAVGHILEHLPAGFPAAIVVVQHLDPRHRSLGRQAAPR